MKVEHFNNCFAPSFIFILQQKLNELQGIQLEKSVKSEEFSVISLFFVCILIMLILVDKFFWCIIK
jgi:hypothetical protein